LPTCPRAAGEGHKRSKSSCIHARSPAAAPGPMCIDRTPASPWLTYRRGRRRRDRTMLATAVFGVSCTTHGIIIRVVAGSFASR
jgi:hypothetical protein